LKLLLVDVDQSLDLKGLLYVLCAKEICEAAKGATLDPSEPVVIITSGAINTSNSTAVALAVAAVVGLACVLFMSSKLKNEFCYVT